MANPSKFVSVNLNKSYGKATGSSSSSTSSSSSAFGHGSRARPGSGGGGMVVLSRPRSSVSTGQKTGSRLAVPPPLNLPSLRKEHELFDPSSTGSSTGAASSGLGSGHGPSAMGWTKPAFQDKEAAGDQVGRLATGDQRVSSPVYMPPGAHSVGQPFSAVASGRALMAEKAVVLRGEDFPSLLAAFTSSQKHKDALNQKQVQEEPSDGQAKRPSMRSPLGMRPQIGSSRLVDDKGLDGNGGLSHPSAGLEQLRKRDGVLLSPFPLVQLVHTSDWADDERDTGHGIPDRDRDRGFSRMESVRVYDLPDRRGPHDSESGSVPSREFFRGDSFGRDLTTSNSEGRDISSWRAPSHSRDGFGAREVGVDRDGVGTRPFGLRRETGIENNKYGQSPNGDSARKGFTNGIHDSHYNRRDLGYGQNILNGKNGAVTFNGRNAEQSMRGRYGDPSNNWYRGNALQNSTAPKAPFSSGSKGFSLNDPILNFGREKSFFSNSRKPYQEDAGFDSNDPFSGGLIGDVSLKVFKRKKDMQKQADFHDPARESFEAELERVQRIQEQERQHMLEEQARAVDLARKEEEERERLSREEEERRRKLEEEAMEASWRAEQERLEAMKRDEEQKLAREEEKRRIFMEEERRKEAARQKLLELEARMVRRQAQAAINDGRFSSAHGNERIAGAAKEQDAPRAADVGDWEDCERMVEQITSSVSSDSSSMNRFFETGSRPNSSRDGNPSIIERGKHANSWKRNAYDNGNNSVLLQDHENGYHSPRRDAFGTGRAFPRKELFVGPGAASVRPSSKGGIPEPSQMLDDFRNSRGTRWNVARDSDHYDRNSDLDAEFIDNDKFGDDGWGHSRSRGSPHALYADRLFQNSEVDGFSSFGRARHSLRQPRVLPPPSMSSIHKSSLRAAPELPSSSISLERETRYQTAGKTEEESIQMEYESRYQEKFQQPGTIASPQEKTISAEQKEEKRCDSQSSLCVSSPPSSPTHLSHDDLDESGDFPALPAYADGERLALASEVGKTGTVTASGSVSHGEDDEWAIENNQEIQEQEVYDEEEDGYQEEDGVHEGDNMILDPAQEFEDLHPDMANVTSEMDQLVLGFDEGVEVIIPSTDEFERTSESGENETQIEPVGAAQETGPLVGFASNAEHSLHAENTFPDGMGERSSIIVTETEKALQDLTLQPVASTSYAVDSVDTSGGSGIPAQKPVTSAFNLPLPSTSLAQSILPSVTAVPNQAEVPVKLQFGLFSGPSLIPSPVPAIQIGSIQMPLHLHPPVGPSLTQVHPSQPPYFQFGQLRYTSPISQGILPLTSQSMPFVQSAAPAHFSLNQKLGGSLHREMNHNSSTHSASSNDKMPSVLLNNHMGLVTKTFNLSQEKSDCKEPSTLPNIRKREVSSQRQSESSMYGENKTNCKSICQVEHQGAPGVTLNIRSVGSSREPQGSLVEPVSSQFLSGEKAVSGPKCLGTVSGSRGKRYVYTVRNSSRSFPGSDTSRTDSGGFQRRPRRNIRRTEFRVRENNWKRTEGMDSSNYVEQDELPNFNGRLTGISVRNGAKRDHFLNKSTKLVIESQSLTSGASSSQEVNSEGKLGKTSVKEPASKKLISSVDNLQPGEGSLKRNSRSEEDVDASLQSGVVRIFNQPGIEAPSDEDDFIEVRSKRQMLNDRREKREREIKAKSRVIKAPRKSLSVSQSNVVASSVHSDPVVSDGTGFGNGEQSTVFTTNTACPPLPPIGTPAVNAGADKRLKMKSVQTSSVSVISTGASKVVPGLSFENKNVVANNVPTSLGSWDHLHMNPQVMTLTQTQLDEAMKPVQFDTHVDSTGDHTGIVLEPAKQTASVMSQDKSFSLSVRPLNSLLAWEKIQFGAVTSPTILPPVSRAVTNGIGPPGSGSCRDDVSIEHSLSAPENNCSMFFEKEKHPDESGVHLEDPEAEAEAEAAASAVAVAVISCDEVVGNGLGVCSVSADTKSFRGSREVTSQSASEESLSVALPADLSVETPLSLWPTLPSQSSPSSILSHFPGPPPSHFPCFEMNPMLGGPIFSFGPHDESGTTQSQPQRSTTLGSTPLGAWPQCHSSMDSFYGAPAGFTGPFISPPGAIPGVQGPPHMFFYNHFPVGQFGQQVLSFMGTAYIPSGKQPDWKHNPVSTAVGVSEGDINNPNVVPGIQRNPPNMPASIQHQAAGSPFLPMASPLAMFDMSPFQSSADIPLQARWPHVPVPPLHSVPPSVPLQQHQVDGGMPPKRSHSLHVDSSTGNNRFHEPRLSTPSDGSRKFSVPTSPAQFPEELGLVDTHSGITAYVKKGKPSYSSSSGNNSKGPNGAKSSSSTVASGGESGGIRTSSSNNSSQSMGPAFKPEASQPSISSAQQYLHPVGYADQRGGGASSQKMGSGGEWHRRMGFQGRNQMSLAEKSFSTSKVKQIYVAKPPTTSGAATPG